MKMRVVASVASLRPKMSLILAQMMIMPMEPVQTLLSNNISHAYALTSVRDQIARNNPSSLLKVMQVVGDRYQGRPDY